MAGQWNTEELCQYLGSYPQVGDSFWSNYSLYRVTVVTSTYCTVVEEELE